MSNHLEEVLPVIESLSWRLQELKKKVEGARLNPPARMTASTSEAGRATKLRKRRNEPNLSNTIKHLTECLTSIENQVNDFLGNSITQPNPCGQGPGPSPSLPNLELCPTEQQQMSNGECILPPDDQGDTTQNDQGSSADKDISPDVEENSRPTGAVPMSGATRDAGLIEVAQFGKSTSSGTHKPPTFTIKEDKMGPLMLESILDKVKTIDRARFQEYGYYKVKIDGLDCVDWSHITQIVRQPDKDQLQWVQYAPRGKGTFTKLHASPSKSTKFELPDFSIAPAPVTSQEALQEFWQRLADHPPSDPIPYYVGPPLCTSHTMSSLNDLLHPGEKLLRRNHGELPGINSVYWLAGKGLSRTAWHIEDARLPSVNLVLAGTKNWMFIEPCQNDEFEDFIREASSSIATCSQFVRHLNILPSPAQLKARGIKFKLECCGPTEMIITGPHTYHAAINPVDNFALAINIELPSSPDMPKGYRWCQKGIERCGPHVPTKEDFYLSPGGPLAPQKRQHHHEGKSLCRKKRCLKPLTSLPTRLAAAVRSPESLSLCCNLIRSWRENNIDFRPFSLPDRAGSVNQAAKYTAFISLLECKPELKEFLSRFSKMCLAEELDKKKAWKADPEQITGLLSALNWPCDDKRRSKLHSWLKEGRKWRALCGNWRGLLCYIPLQPLKLHGFTKEDLLRMKEGEIAAFHTLFETPSDLTGALEYMGRLLQTAILRNDQAVGRFVWEGENEESLKHLSETDLLPLLAPFRWTNVNRFKPEEFPDWPRPEDWPDSLTWPENPAAIPANEKQCDWCEAQECLCVNTIFPRQQPEITQYDHKGWGVQAPRKPEKGDVTYLAGGKIGQLVGDLVPPSIYRDAHVFEFRRSDIAGEPIPCHIYCKYTGNWAGLLNHACKPSARFTGTRISGMYRIIVEAIRDIKVSEEITVSFDRKFRRGRGRCSCESCT